MYLTRLEIPILINKLFKFQFCLSRFKYSDRFLIIRVLMAIVQHLFVQNGQNCRCESVPDDNVISYNSLIKFRKFKKKTKLGTPSKCGLLKMKYCIVFYFNPLKQGSYVMTYFSRLSKKRNV